MIGIFACDLGRFLVGEIFNTLISLQVDFDVDKGSVLYNFSTFRAIPWGKMLRTGFVNL